MVENDDIQNIVNDNKTPQDACRSLITKANLNGGHDNISVVIVTGPEH